MTTLEIFITHDNSSVFWRSLASVSCIFLVDSTFSVNCQRRHVRLPGYTEYGYRLHFLKEILRRMPFFCMAMVFYYLYKDAVLWFFSCAIQVDKFAQTSSSSSDGRNVRGSQLLCLPHYLVFFPADFWAKRETTRSLTLSLMKISIRPIILNIS